MPGMNDTEYRELSKEIGQVKLTMTEKLGEVLASVRELGATMRSGLDQIKDMREDLDKVKETAIAAKNSTDSAHIRINTMHESINDVPKIPAIDARVGKLEKIVFWGGTTIIGAVVLAGMALLLQQGG
jgi:hypothetical protein